MSGGVVVWWCGGVPVSVSAYSAVVCDDDEPVRLRSLLVLSAFLLALAQRCIAVQGLALSLVAGPSTREHVSSSRNVFTVAEMGTQLLE